MLRTGLVVPVLEFIRPACALMWGSENTPRNPKQMLLLPPGPPSTLGLLAAMGSKELSRLISSSALARTQLMEAFRRLV